MKKAELPKPLQTLIDISKVNMVNINLTHKPNDYTPSTDSKIGGMGYLPMGEDYPTKKNGNPLFLLAQINFKQLAEQVDMDKLPYAIPTSGILQIYIDPKDSDFLYGCDLDDYLPHDKYQVRYWADDSTAINTDTLHQAANMLKALGGGDLPFDMGDEFMISFALGEQSCSVECYEYEHFSKQIAELNGIDVWEYFEDKLSIDDPDEYLQAYFEIGNTKRHQLFGYPDFTQTDPRVYNEHLQEHILLFQIETDDYIMWGDSGVANFFIHPDDLKAGDFSKLIYNWDCC